MRSIVPVLACALLALTACATPSSEEAREGVSGALRAADGGAIAELAYTPQLVLEKVLERKHLAFDPQKPFPEIRFASRMTLAEFQDAMEPQWGIRPNAITNAYAVARNTIYLMDDANYYTSHRRCIDDSLAHELTHYVQVKYQGWVLDGMDDSIETNAIDVQTWFREQFCQQH